MFLFHRTPTAVAAVFAFSLMTCALQARAGIVIDGTRVIYDAEQGEKTVKLRNDGRSPVLTQSWIDAGNQDLALNKLKVPFVLGPALQRVDCQKEQVLRIRATPSPALPLPSDRESVFYLNVLEIPPEARSAKGSCGPADSASAAGVEPAGNSLQLAIRSRIKLFYRPADLKGNAAEAASKLQWAADGQTLHIRNPTAYHVSLTEVSVDGVTATNPKMIAPFSETSMKMDGAVRAGNLQFKWLNDYGSVVETAASVGAGQ